MLIGKKNVKEVRQLNLTNCQSKQDEEYDGLSDTDSSSWFNVSFLKKKFAEYNRRFFGNRLINETPIVINSRSVHGGKLGCCILSKHPMMNDVLVERIEIANKCFANRFCLEDTLIHEMCHVYQIHVLCHCRLDELSADDKTSTGGPGHGKKFSEAANMINNSPENKEKFNITQYSGIDQIKLKKMKNVEGWLVVKPDLLKIGILMYANTPNGRSGIVNYEKNIIYTYNDGEVKAQIYHQIGRSRYYYRYKEFSKDICDMIKNKKLIKFGSPSSKKISIIYAEDNSGDKYLIATDDLNKNIDELKLNKETLKFYEFLSPYDQIQNDIQPTCLKMDDNLIIQFEEMINDGVIKRKIS